MKALLTPFRVGIAIGFLAALGWCRDGHSQELPECRSGPPGIPALPLQLELVSSSGGRQEFCPLITGERSLFVPAVAGRLRAMQMLTPSMWRTQVDGTDGTGLTGALASLRKLSDCRFVSVGSWFYLDPAEEQPVIQRFGRGSPEHLNLVIGQRFDVSATVTTRSVDSPIVNRVVVTYRRRDSMTRCTYAPEGGVIRGDDTP